MVVGYHHFRKPPNSDGLRCFFGETSLRWKKDTPKAGILVFFFLRKIVISKEISPKLVGSYWNINNLMVSLWEVVLPNFWGACFSSDEAQAISEVGLRSNRWVGKSFNKYTQMKANLPYVEQTWECEFWGEYSCGLTFNFYATEPHSRYV